MGSSLHAIQRARASGKGIGLYAEALKNADEQMAQRLILLLDRTAPAGVADDTGAGQTTVLKQIDVLEVAAVVEAEIRAAGGNDGIIPREVKTAGGRAVHGEGVVEHVALAGRFGRVLELLHKTPELDHLIAVVGAEIQPAVGFLHGMRQAMRAAQADGLGKQVVRTFAVFPAELERRHTGGVAQEGEINQVVHALEILLGLGGASFQMQVGGIDIGQWRVQPAPGLGEPDLGVPNGVEILLERFLIALGKFTAKRAGFLDEKIQRALASGQSSRGFLAIGHEQQVENLLGLVHRRDGAAFPVEGLRLRAARPTDAAVGGHHQGSVPGGIADVLGVELIQRNGILVGAVALGVGAGQVLVRIGVTVHAPNGRMGKPGIDGNVAPQGFEDIEHLGELEIFFAAMREPAPVFPCRIFPNGHTDAVGMIDADKPLRRRVGLEIVRRKRFEPRQSQSDAGSAQKRSACECACIRCPHLKNNIEVSLLFGVKNATLNK